MLFLEFGSSASDQYLERNADIARHDLFADDPEKKVASLMVPALNKMGLTPANPSPPPQDLREGCQMMMELCNAWHQVAEQCAERGEGGTKEQVSDPQV